MPLSFLCSPSENEEQKKLRRTQALILFRALTRHKAQKNASELKVIIV
jgi:hypothetical protein